MSDKQRAIDAISTMPSASSWQDIQEKIELITAVKESQKAVKNRQITAHEEVKKMLSQWTSK